MLRVCFLTAQHCSALPYYSFLGKNCSTSQLNTKGYNEWVPTFPRLALR